MDEESEAQRGQETRPRPDSWPGPEPEPELKAQDVLITSYYLHMQRCSANSIR